MSNSSRFVRDVTIPDDTRVSPGEEFTKTWRVENNGSTPWGPGYHLVFAGGNPMTDILGHPVSATEPGQQTDLSIQFVAPSAPGTHYSDWLIQDELGNQFGEIIYVRIVVRHVETRSIPGAPALMSNGRYLADLTYPDGARVAAGSAFRKAWLVENTGSHDWGADFQLVHVDHDPLTDKRHQPLATAAPGQRIEVSVDMAAPDKCGRYRSHWRMQDARGRAFGDLLFVEVNVVPALDHTWRFDPMSWRQTIWAITSIFESGRPEGDPAAFQTLDAGIVSYGKHQATLGSGTLHRVVQAYTERCDSVASRTLRRLYLNRLASADASLRSDNRLRELLLMAARDTAMEEAQDAVFDQLYYRPTITQARQHNVSSPLGLACIYDTQVQGGLFILLPRVQERLGGIIGETGHTGTIDEADWIERFLDLRERRLRQLADDAEVRGDQLNANALRISTFRVDELCKLLRADNLGLEGEFTVRGQTVKGISHEPQVDVRETRVATHSNAQFVADASILDDTLVRAGHTFTKTWRVKNSGDTRWTADFTLVHVDGEQLASESSHAVPTVPPGDTVELSIEMTAPQSPGLHFTDWRLKDADGNEFGDLLYARIIVEAAPAEAPELAANSLFVSDVSIPDDTVVAAGDTFTKIWRVRNTGEQAWVRGFTLDFIGGTAMTGMTSIPLPAASPGQQVDISLELKAPSAPGTYFGDWRMKDGRGTPFGQVVYLRIIVPSPAGESLATPLSQRDPLWAEKRLGYSDSDKSIGEWGCLMSCFTMVANTFGHPVTPAQFNDAMLRRRGFIQPNLTKWNALNNVYGDIVFEGKIDPRHDILDRINASLGQGNPVTVQVDFTRDTPYTDNDQHWVLIVGRDGDDYRINDPWLLPAQEASLQDRYGRTGQPLRDAVMAAIFYRSAKKTKTVPVGVPPAETEAPTVPTQLQTGMNINPDAPHSNPMDSDDLKGMDWVRFVFKLAAREIEAERDDIDAAFDQYDEIVAKYNRMGLKSLIVLNQETVWGKAPWAGNDDWQTYATELAGVARRIASRYKRFADGVAYEIWNEGDLPENPASVYVEPEQFAIVLKRVAEAIREESPKSPLIFGGLASGPGRSIPYLKRCLAALNDEWPVDAIGIHPYGRWATRAPFDWGQHFGTLGEAFEQYRREIPGIPLWITEIGVAADTPIGPVHYPTIADYIRDVHAHIGERHVSLVPVIIWFAWSDWMRNSGIVERDGRRKEHVYDAFRAVRNREL